MKVTLMIRIKLLVTSVLIGDQQLWLHQALWARPADGRWARGDETLEPTNGGVCRCGTTRWCGKITRRPIGITFSVERQRMKLDTLLGRV